MDWKHKVRHSRGLFLKEKPDMPDDEDCHLAQNSDHQENGSDAPAGKPKKESEWVIVPCTLEQVAQELEEMGYVIQRLGQDFIIGIKPPGFV